MNLIPTEVGYWWWRESKSHRWEIKEISTWPSRAQEDEEETLHVMQSALCGQPVDAFNKHAPIGSEWGGQALPPGHYNEAYDELHPIEEWWKKQRSGAGGDDHCFERAISESRGRIDSTVGQLKYAMEVDRDETVKRICINHALAVESLQHAKVADLPDRIVDLAEEWRASLEIEEVR
jgi:hypothetical protein